MHVSPQSGFGGDLAPIRIPSVIPLFPLPNVVFFPRTYLPLHIFESRYRRMVRDAAASHQMIGMVLLKEGWETDYEGDRKSTRLNSSHGYISYAVFCLKKKKKSDVK